MIPKLWRLVVGWIFVVAVVSSAKQVERPVQNFQGFGKELESHFSYRLTLAVAKGIMRLNSFLDELMLTAHSTVHSMNAITDSTASAIGGKMVRVQGNVKPSLLKHKSVNGFKYSPRRVYYHDRNGSNIKYWTIVTLLMVVSSAIAIVIAVYVTRRTRQNKRWSNFTDEWDEQRQPMLQASAPFDADYQI